MVYIFIESQESFSYDKFQNIAEGQVIESNIT